MTFKRPHASHPMSSTYKRIIVPRLTTRPVSVGLTSADHLSARRRQSLCSWQPGRWEMATAATRTHPNRLAPWHPTADRTYYSDTNLGKLWTQGGHPYPPCRGIPFKWLPVVGPSNREFWPTWLPWQRLTIMGLGVLYHISFFSTGIHLWRYMRILFSWYL